MSKAQQIGRLIRLLDGTRTLTEASEKSGLHPQTALCYVRTWHRLGACHVSKVQGRAGDGRKTVLLYKIGPGQDVRPPYKVSAKQRNWVRAVTIALLIKRLDGLHTLDELVEEVGLEPRPMRELLKELHKSGAIRIAGWEEGYTGVKARPMYALNRGGRPANEPPRPEAKSNAQRLKERRQLRKTAAINSMFAGNAEQFKEAA